MRWELVLIAVLVLLAWAAIGAAVLLSLADLVVPQ